MRTTSLPVRYAVARWGERWPEADLDGLTADPAGELRLRLLPGLDPAVVSPPADPPPSGLALDCSCGLYVADTSGNRIIRVGLDCPDEVVLPGAGGTSGLGLLQSPAGLAWGPHGWLFAGCGDGRVLVLSAPELALRDVWTGFGRPAYLAGHRDFVLVADTGARRLRRLDWRGRPDTAFDAAVAAPGGPGDPRGVAVAADGTIFVADAATGAVLRLSWSGGAGPLVAAGLAPRSLAIAGPTLYVSDAASGQVLTFAVADGKALGPVSGFTGSVTALAADESGLHIKTGPDQAYLFAPGASAYRATGSVTIGPLDAGQQSGWTRAEVAAQVPALTTVDLAWYTDSTPTPASVSWTTAPSLDFLLDGNRYLWLRATAATRDPGSSPTLYQLGAQTAGDSYLDYLPYVYEHDPAGREGLSAQTLSQADPAQLEPGDLEYLRLLYARTPPQGHEIGRLLDLARSQLGGLEQAIDALPASFDPATAPAGSLSWLASWMAFDLPPWLLDGTRPDEVRRLLLGLAALYRRRSTPRGVADFVEVYAGVRPYVMEDFRERPLWVLGDTPLGFGTGLPDREAEGMLVGEAMVGQTGPEDPATLGAALFASTAHRFTVLVPAAGRTVDRLLVTQVVEAEKPAHNGFHLCFADSRMRVGIQARIGVDALVAAGPEEITLGETAVLRGGTVLAGPEVGPASVGTHGHVGIDTLLT